MRFAGAVDGARCGRTVRSRITYVQKIVEKSSVWAGEVDAALVLHREALTRELGFGAQVLSLVWC